MVKLESKSNELSGDELYMIDYGLFRLQNDSKAIEFYDKAMAKGLDNNCRSGNAVQTGLFNRIGRRITPFVNVRIKKDKSLSSKMN